MPNFTYGDNILENLNSYKYLGIIMHKNGQFIQAINDRTTKTNRAIHMLRQILGYTNNAAIKLALSLFDKQMQPILIYGCSIWSMSDHNRHIMIHLDRTETKVKQQVNNICDDRLQRHIKIDEIRAYRVLNIEDKIDLLYKSSNTEQIQIVDHVIKQQTTF